MGSLAKELKNKSVSELGENVWQTHTDTVDAYWEAIESYFNNIEIYIRGTKIYQDGMFVDGEVAMKIIEAGIQSGSKNSEIVLNLIKRGATLIRTEDFKMVKDEYDGIQSILKAKTSIRKIWYLLRYKVLKPVFLIRRDRFIAGRIAETLARSETGILFIGAYHNVLKKLPGDITVIELKEIAKVRKYQKTIQSDDKSKTLLLEELTQYLIKK